MFDSAELAASFALPDSPDSVEACAIIDDAVEDEITLELIKLRRVGVPVMERFIIFGLLGVTHNEVLLAMVFVDICWLAELLANINDMLREKLLVTVPPSADVKLGELVLAN